MHAHFSSGGRYPVLRSLAILYMVGSVFALIGGIVLACWMLFRLPDTMANRIPFALITLAMTFFVVLTTMAIAEVLKLFIDVEHNTRAAYHTAAASAEAMAAANEAAADSAGPNGARMGAKRWLEGEETAEGALLRGH